LFLSQSKDSSIDVELEREYKKSSMKQVELQKSFEYAELEYKLLLQIEET